MYKELEPLQKVLPLLHLLKGFDWEHRHWKQLFRLLNIKSNGLMIDTLKLKDFVNCAHVIAAKTEDIKALNAQASV